jgi:hypothetical protein
MLVHAVADARQAELSGGGETRAGAEPALQRAMNARAQVRAQMQLGRSLNAGPAAVAQRKLMRTLAHPEQPPVQRNANETGMPDALKAGIESLSGMSLDGVRVHYGSPTPATLQAHAYAQGSDIHLAPGAERHLPHEAWHVVQQAQGRVQPTMQLQGTAINDDAGLEREADAMGEKALSLRLSEQVADTDEVAQRMEKRPLQRRLMIGMLTIGSMQEAANSAAAWQQYANLSGPQRAAFRSLVGNSADYAMYDVVNLADTVNWLESNRLLADPLFADLTPREFSSLSFLVKEAVYRDWANRAQAIAFLLTLPNADASDFAHRYKSYYHLWRRFEVAGEADPTARTQEAMFQIESGVSSANIEPGAQPGTTEDQQAYIQNLAAAGLLRFGSRAAAAGHLIKHGSYLKQQGKITGEEGSSSLAAMGTDYIAHANYVVAHGTPAGLSNAPGGFVYAFTFRSQQGQDYRALVQYDVEAGAAYLLSYYPSEPQNVVMDL